MLHDIYPSILRFADTTLTQTNVSENKKHVATHGPFFLDTDASHLSWQRDFIIIVAKFIFDPWKFAIEKKKGSSESLEAQMVEYLREQVAY